MTEARHNQIERLPVISLQPHEENYRFHPMQQRQDIGVGVRRYGQWSTAVVSRRKDGTDVLLGRHGFVESVTEQGWVEVDCTVLTGLSYEDELAIMAGDNHLAQGSEDNLPKLASIVERVRNMGIPQAVTGFTPSLLEGLHERIASAAVAAKDAAAQKTGDINALSKLTLKLNKVQAPIVAEAIEAAHKVAGPYDYGSEDVASNAITFICEAFLRETSGIGD